MLTQHQVSQEISFFIVILNRGYRGRSYKIKFHFKGKVIHKRCIYHPVCIGEKPWNILSCFSCFSFLIFFVNTVLTQIDVHTTMNFKSFLEFLTQSLQCVCTKTNTTVFTQTTFPGSWHVAQNYISISVKKVVRLFIILYQNWGSLFRMLYFG